MPDEFSEHFVRVDPEGHEGMLPHYATPAQHAKIATQNERYEMLINHALHDNQYPPHALTFMLLSQTDTHYLFEVACTAYACEWWDHWDEPKEQGQ